MRHFTRSIT